MPENILNPERGIALFTDGSCWTGDKVGGWAWVAVDAFGNEDHQSGFTKHTTISQMELYAVTRGLEMVLYDYGEQDVLVYSDSEYVVLGFNDKKRKRTKNREWWQALEQFAAQLGTVEMEHVRGHAGDRYNELADDLAGAARKEGQSNG